MNTTAMPKLNVPPEHADRPAEPKVAPSGESAMADVLARAAAAVEGLAHDYATWALADVQKCREALELARPNTPIRREYVHQVFRIAHDIKGQGSSFGYPLVTKIAHSLCALTRDPDRTYLDHHLDLVKSHLDAVQLVLTKQIKGEGGEIGSKLADKLRVLVEEAIGKAV